jgi:ABC-type multidrug transport system ATPase subunit
MFWLNPLAYAFKAMMSSEFMSTTISCIGSEFPPYPNVPAAFKTCTLPGALPGSTSVSGEDWLWATRQIPSGTAVIWYNFAAVCGLTVVYIVLAAIVTSRKEFGKGGVTSNIYKTGHAPKDSNKTYVPSTIKGAGDTMIKAIGGASAVVEMSSLNPLNAENGKLQTNDLKPSAFAAKRKSSQHLASSKRAIQAPTLTFKDLSYSITVARGIEKQLLDGVSGRVVPGRLLALVGFTGAGKTTLQDVLARRKTAGRIDGTVLVDDKLQTDSFKRIAAYCEQSDVLNPAFTVRESLRYSAYLRQPADVSKADKEAYVEQVIDILGMGQIAEALVGSIEKGVGIGLVDRKRLNIGLQLVAKPSVLILDEPTSGLDSYAAFQIVRLLRNLADLGLAIFCTIHQPSALLFELFDDVMLIGNGGKAVYYGEIGFESQTVTSYFARNGAMPIPAGENPSEYVLDAGNGLRDAGGINSQKWPEIWKASPEYEALMLTIDQTVAGMSTEVDTSEETGEFALSTWRQIPIVTKYTMLAYYRDGAYNFGRIALAIIQAIIVGFTFWQMPNSASGAILQMFALFCIVTLGIPFIIVPVAPFDDRRRYFFRDSASGMYDYFAFSVGIIVADFPFTMLPPTGSDDVSLDGRDEGLGVWGCGGVVDTRISRPHHHCHQLPPRPLSDCATAPPTMTLKMLVMQTLCLFCRS